MSDGAVTVKVRKVLVNPLLGRKQLVRKGRAGRRARAGWLGLGGRAGPLAPLPKPRLTRPPLPPSPPTPLPLPCLFPRLWR